MARIIYNPIYRCPYCGHEQPGMFPTAQYEAGSAGHRTYWCPACGQEVDE